MVRDSESDTQISAADSLCFREMELDVQDSASFQYWEVH
jgi:hypothetical protein